MSQYNSNIKASSSSSSSTTLQLLTSFVSGAITICTVQYVLGKYYYSHRRRQKLNDRTNGTYGILYPITRQSLNCKKEKIVRSILLTIYCNH